MSTTGESWDLESGTFTYDSVGNVLTAPAPYGLTAATYDCRNLPTSQTANSVTSAYRYDGSGQRISKQVGSGDTEYYVLEGPLTLAVFTLDGSGDPTAWHFNLEAAGAVVGRETGGGDRYYYHTDMLGSTRTVVDDEGTAVEGYFYYLFGLLSENLSPNAGGTKEGFTGKEVDAESELQYFGARYYMPALTRWGQVDPMADAYPSRTPYNYVLGNPVGLVDPDGMCPESESAGCADEANDAATEAGQAEGAEQAGGQDPCPPCRLVLAGARGGSLVGGSVAGPPGAVTGGIIGATIGIAVGVILAEATQSDKSGSDAFPNPLDDPGSIEGLSDEDVVSRRPEAVRETETPTERTPEPGRRFEVPGHRGDQVRIMRGDPAAKDPLHQGPRAIISRHGKVTRVPLRGNPVLKPKS